MEAALLTPDELQGYVGVALRGVLAGSLTPGQASAIASLVRAAIIAREATEVEDRLRGLEERAGIERRVS